MKIKLPAVEAKPLSGKEAFQNGETKKAFCLSDFWRWSFSNLINNVTRGHLAEFIVARALGVSGVRKEWAACDLEIPNPKGGDKIKVEVKSAAYLQEWEQSDKSLIGFNVRKTRAINSKTGLYSGRPMRHSDVYVLAHYTEEVDKDSMIALKLDKWVFYVVPTTSLNKRERSQHSITLNSLKKEKAKLKMEEVKFSGLKAAVEKAGSK